MKYIFQRQYVAPDNKGYLKGVEVPENFEKERAERLVEAGIIMVVETPQEFVENIENEEIENLDPERKPKGKRG